MFFPHLGQMPTGSRLETLLLFLTGTLFRSGLFSSSMTELTKFLTSQIKLSAFTPFSLIFVKTCSHSAVLSTAFTLSGTEAIKFLKNRDLQQLNDSKRGERKIYKIINSNQNVKPKSTDNISYLCFFYFIIVPKTLTYYIVRCIIII